MVNLIPIKPVACPYCLNVLAERQGDVLIHHSLRLQLRESQPIDCPICHRRLWVNVDKKKAQQVAEK
jgi:uncharacterized protein YbaR (Trm112 family)